MQNGALEKCRKNELCLGKWLALELKQIRLADYFLERGIMQICLYGYGTMGKLVVQALENSPIKILCVIDKNAGAEFDISSKGLSFYKEIPKGLKNEFVLSSVIWDRIRIVDELKTAGYKRILLLDYIIDLLFLEANSGSRKSRYPELKKYSDISDMKNLQVVNFGTGLGYYDFCYDGLDILAFNFSLPQQSLEFDYKLMMFYQDKFSINCNICLVLPFFIFLAAHIEEASEINERYYSILPAKDVISQCNTTYEAYLQRRKEWPTENLELTEIPKTEIRKKQVDELLNIWREELGIISYEKAVVTQRQSLEMKICKTWFVKILEFCQAKQLKPVIIIPPMSQELLDKISLNFRQTYFYDVLYEVVDRDVPILDYSKNEIFCNPAFYSVPCFLAKDKAVLFTRDVLQRIGVLQ